MKTRIGFVSNSSSTSFCIYGTFIEGKDYKDTGQIMSDVSGYFYGSTPDNYEEGTYVGRPWKCIGGEETGNQLKENVEKTLTDKFGPGLIFGTFEEAFNDNF